MSDTKIKESFAKIEHIIIRVLLIMLLVISCIKLLLIEVTGLNH
jgi:hypothetical protein